MEALFLDGRQGPLFCVYHPAAIQRRERIGLVYLPPFAEEMNRSRRMVALQARRLAALGVDVLLLDLFGTGDSAGDFGEARWEAWREDAKAAMDWLSARCAGRVGLWGLRLGALLAAEVAAEAPSGLARLLLWQPVLSGERHLTQFLRLRVAASMGKGSGKETARDLRARLSQGEALEIAGYELAPALAEAIAGLQLAALLARLKGLRPDLMEVSAGEVPAPAPATQKLLAELERQGLPHTAHAVCGEPFWSIQEITLAPRLLDATDALFQP
jgi:exosortase A-associated hydrolase 2